MGETWIFGSHPLVSLRRTGSRVSLVLLCLTAQSQLTSWFPVGITARRVHAAQLDKTCGRRNDMAVFTIRKVDSLKARKNRLFL